MAPFRPQTRQEAVLAELRRGIDEGLWEASSSPEPDLSSPARVFDISDPALDRPQSALLTFTEVHFRKTKSSGSAPCHCWTERIRAGTGWTVLTPMDQEACHERDHHRQQPKTDQRGPRSRRGPQLGVYSLFAMWMSDVHSIGGYTFAAGLFFLRLSGWWVLSALVIGIVVVFALMNLSGFAGQRLGVPYPVLARVSFGVFGANLPTLIRAIIDPEAPVGHGS